MNYYRWIKHFEQNSNQRKEPNWDAPFHITQPALRKLSRSIQQFQLGDGGGPAYLIAWNRDRYLSDPLLKRVVDLWFEEEKEHSRLLGRMLQRLETEEIQDHWSFSLFCTVRKIFGVRFELQALLGTEIVSNVYYKMLRRYGNDEALRGMCDLIIRDETGHIAFHRARIADEATVSSPSLGIVWGVLFRLRALMAGTVLWINHRGAVIALGGTDAEFYRSIWNDTGKFIKAIRRDTARLKNLRKMGRKISSRIGGLCG